MSSGRILSGFFILRGCDVVGCAVSDFAGVRDAFLACSGFGSGSSLVLFAGTPFSFGLYLCGPTEGYCRNV